MIIINFTIFLSPYKEIPYTLAVIPLVSLPSKPSVQFTHSVITMTNLDSILKSRDVTLPTNVPLVKAMVFFQ